MNSGREAGVVFFVIVALAACTSHPMVSMGVQDANSPTSPTPGEDAGSPGDVVVDLPLGGGGAGGADGSSDASGKGGAVATGGLGAAGTGGGTGGAVATGGLATGGGGGSAGRDGTGGGLATGGNGTGARDGTGGAAASGGSVATGGTGTGGAGGIGGRSGTGGSQSTGGHDGGSGDGGIAVCGGKSPATYREVCGLCGAAVTCTGSCSVLGCLDSTMTNDEGCDVGNPVGQIYTAATTGTLVGVAVSIIAYAGSTSPLHIAVHAVDQGIPGAVLGEATLAGAASSLDQVIVFPKTIQQVAGRQYALIASYPGAGPGSQGLWSGSTGDPYAGGSLVISLDAGSWRAEADIDQHFRVYVVPN
jgi:hypothetical protein